jgi:hypothetical protein
VLSHSLSLPVAVCQVRSHHKGADTSSGSFYSADGGSSFVFPFTKWVVFETGSDVAMLQYVECFGSYAGRPFGIYIKDSSLFPVDDEYSFVVRPHQQYVVGVSISEFGAVSLNINGVSYAYSPTLSESFISSELNIGSGLGGSDLFSGVVQRFSLFNSVVDESLFKRMWNQGDPVSYVLPSEFKVSGSSLRCIREYLPCNLVSDVWSTTPPASSVVSKWYDSSLWLGFQDAYDASLLSSAGGFDLAVRGNPHAAFIFDKDGYLYVALSVVWLARPNGSSGSFDVFSNRSWNIE